MLHRPITHHLLCEQELRLSVAGRRASGAGWGEEGDGGDGVVRVGGIVLGGERGLERDDVGGGVGL